MCENCIHGEKVLISINPALVGYVAYRCPKHGIMPTVTMCQDYEQKDHDTYATKKDRRK